jgi:hypothetical protein
MSGALNTRAQEPFGRVLLDIVALGLAAYGVYSPAETCSRRVGHA